MDQSSALLDDNGQGLLFNRNRFSPVRVSGWLRLPASVARDFGVATALGKSMTLRRDFAAAHGIKDISCVVVQKGQRRAILDALAITPRHWRRLVQEWQMARMAHRCDRDNVTLFITGDEFVCPRCDALLDDEERSGSRPPKVQITSPKGPDHVRLGSGLRPPKVRITSASEHESGGPSAGAKEGYQGMKKGLGVSEEEQASGQEVWVYPELRGRWRCECGSWNLPGRPCWTPGKHGEEAMPGA